MPDRGETGRLRRALDTKAAGSSQKLIADEEEEARG